MAGSTLPGRAPIGIVHDDGRARAERGHRRNRVLPRRPRQRRTAISGTRPLLPGVPGLSRREPYQSTSAGVGRVADHRRRRDRPPRRPAALDRTAAPAARGRSPHGPPNRLRLSAVPRIALMRDGKLVAIGTPAEVLAPWALRHAYGVEVSVLAAPDGFPVIVPLRTAASI